MEFHLWPGSFASHRHAAQGFVEDRPTPTLLFLPSSTTAPLPRPPSLPGGEAQGLR